MDQVKIGKFIAECRKKNKLTQQQLADIFTKPLGNDQFNFIRRELGMVNPTEL